MPRKKNAVRSTHGGEVNTKADYTPLLATPEVPAFRPPTPVYITTKTVWSDGKITNEETTYPRKP